MRPELVAWWNESAALCEQFVKFQAGRAGGKIAGENRFAALGRSELLERVQLYEAALYRIAGKRVEEMALHEHREKTGGGVTDFDCGRLHGYRRTCRIAAEALGLKPERLL